MSFATAFALLWRRIRQIDLSPEALLTTLSFARRVRASGGDITCGRGQAVLLKATQTEVSDNASRGVSRMLAADVGGTHARVALVDATRADTLEVRCYEKYACAEFPGLGAILKAFVGGLGASDAASIDGGAIACAGYELDGV